MGYYTAISILTWLALAVMCILVHENGRLRKEDKGGLYVAYALIAVSALAEWLAVMLDGVESLPKWPLMLAKCVDYALTPLAGGAIVKQLGMKSRLTKVLDALLTAHVMFQIAALFGGWMVEIDEHNHYHHGDLYIVYRTVYLTVIVLVLLQFRAYGTHFRKQNRSSLFAIMMLIVIGVGFQELIGESRTVYLTLTLAAILLFIHNEEFSKIRQDESLEEKNAQIMTDELTGLLSRRAYLETLKSYESASELPWDLAVFEIDINGLKAVNDTYGHAAGDELICGAAHCIERVFFGAGQCFRTGGDEFVVVARMDRGAADAALEDLGRTSRAWKGAATSGLHLAAGYALARDYPDYSLEKLVARADAVMYEAKRAYYNQPDHDRRKRNAQ
ncbi:MAG: GGDEF domain-containing protein [Atopobiaceae bacterium]|nr:GGDEF domain-containing protein [Atopobiaceae bacterium]